MKPIVLFIIDTLQIGGAEKSLIEITSRFKKYKPVFFQIFKGNSVLPNLEQANLHIKNFNFSTECSLYKIARFIKPEVQSLGPFLIHSTLFRSDIISRHLVKGTDFFLVNSFVNNSYSKERYSSLSFFDKLKLYRIQLWDRFTARNVDYFISNSNTIKLSNSKALNIPNKKVHVIYRGRDFSSFNAVSSNLKISLKKSLNIEEKRIFLNVGRLLTRKGQLDLIKAFNIVHKKHKDTVLLIAGEGKYRSVLQECINIFNLENNVILLGIRNDIPDLLNIADFFVFPSYYEGLPGALIEAIFAKKPVIASLISENIECISPDMAFFFEAGNVDDLSNQMIRALSFNSWIDFTNAAYNSAILKFDINNIAEQYELFYDNLVSK